jgi:hypothetical protein
MIDCSHVDFSSRQVVVPIFWSNASLASTSCVHRCPSRAPWRLFCYRKRMPLLPEKALMLPLLPESEGTVAVEPSKAVAAAVRGRVACRSERWALYPALG